MPIFTNFSLPCQPGQAGYEFSRSQALSTRLTCTPQVYNQEVGSVRQMKRASI